MWPNFGNSVGAAEKQIVQRVFVTTIIYDERPQR